MTGAVAGIDPHQDTFTVGIVDRNGVELATTTFTNQGSGYLEAVDLLATHRVGQVGVEGTASWGQHVAIALVAAGLDVREVPAQRDAQQRRARRLAKTDAVDAVAAARALLAEPTLGPAQALEIYDPPWRREDTVSNRLRPLKVATRVRIPLGVPRTNLQVRGPGVDPGPLSFRRLIARRATPVPQGHRRHRHQAAGRTVIIVALVAVPRVNRRRR